MKKEYFRPSVWKEVKDNLTPEQVEASGFRVYSMTITPELAEKLVNYIESNKLSTFRQSTKNRRRVKFIYTPGFSVKIYYKSDGSYSVCLVDSGATGGGGRDFEEKKAKSLTKIEVYYAILKKYPQDLMSISCSSSEQDDGIPW
ncbi:MULTISPECIES: hypothetical protein [Vibrio]|nr:MULTISPECIES: hypothetical protein [Vibrio]ELB2923561.1 hypothetical protein [Vibrio alginolyticus]MCR9684995.1 hypothetical protein [Vibrio antiquarius]MCS0023738.1 hypothetical protein [Vibrio antiquarius]MCS0232988.1 hypothetical protein [Vibrio alginolyticus]MCS0275005.1 hypothetical protein [Vibrio alginolyticus]